MIPAGSFEYALARMQSRLGRRPSAADWRSLEHVRALESFLARARETGLAAPLEPLRANPGIHEIERAMRAHWRATVEEAARWVPEAWSRAVAWCSALADLPAMAHLAEGREPHAWMREDTSLRTLFEGTGADLAALRASAVLAGASDARSLREAWLAEWRRRLPPGGQAALVAFTRPLGEHLRRFTAADPHDAVALRRDFETRLVAIVHGHLLEPVAIFAWLALAALDLERLRGELATRALVPEGVAP
jgi:hypothetical protein